MAKKGKKSKGKKKGKGTSESTASFISAHEFHERSDAERMALMPDSWLVDNSFQWLSRIIQERTGSIGALVAFRKSSFKRCYAESLILYRDPPIPANEITTKTPSFRSLGFNGGPKTNPMRVKLFYDFKPRLASDSLLLTEPISWSMVSMTPGKEAPTTTGLNAKLKLSERPFPDISFKE